MKINFVKSTEKKRFLRILDERFGIKELRYLLIETGKSKIRGFSGGMNKDDIRALSRIANVEIMGAYLFKKEREDALRLSLDATHLLGDQIKKGVIEIDDVQLESWFRGNDLEIEADNGFCVLQHKKTKDFVGCGISARGKIINHIPKERRIRN